MNIETAKDDAKKYQIPLIAIACTLFILGACKLFGSVALCVIECICAMVLLLGAV